MKITKDMTNVEIMDLLRSVAASYQIKQGNKARFKIIAYENAASAIEHLSSEAKDLWDEGKLEEVSGIGPSIAGHLDEIFKTGKSKHFDDLMEGIPPATFEIMKVSGIGPKTAEKITTKFKISQVHPLIDLRKLAEKGEIAKLEGFGVDSQEAIIKSIDENENREVRLLLPYAEEVAYEIIEWMKSSPDTKEINALGSLRRRASTIGDVDFAASSMNPTRALTHFCNYPKKIRVLEKGDRTASLILPGNKQVDLMVETPEGYGALLAHFTGSKHHNIALRKIANKMGYSLSDYGVKRISDATEKSLKRFKDEESLYKFLGMQWIPPELREDRGEIELAQMGKLPKLIDLKDVRSDLQIHSDFDIETSHDLGVSSMAEIAQKADDLGYEYIAFTEHNPSHSRHSKSQIVNLLKKKSEAVTRLNHVMRHSHLKKVFNSLEIDILPSGELPVSEAGLATLDFALVSIHSSFRLGKTEMTKRVLAGLDNPKVKIFAHPTARKINEREGIELDWEKIFEFCKSRSIWIEINAAPSRLDLPDNLVKDAISRGILLTLGTDAHNASQMDNMPYGVSVARRGWCEKDHIVNTRSLNDFEKIIN